MNSSETMIDLYEVKKALREKFGEGAVTVLLKQVARPFALLEESEDGDGFVLRCPECNTVGEITYEQWVKNVCSVVEVDQESYYPSEDEVDWATACDEHMRCTSCGQELEIPDGLWGW